MLKLFNNHYYVDLDEIENVVNLEIVQLSGGSSEQQIKFVKYDIIKMMLETVLTEREEVDDSLGLQSSNGTTIPFKISFNTLLQNKIIKKYDI
jgi:hypothetical protein